MNNKAQYIIYFLFPNIACPLTTMKIFATVIFNCTHNKKS